MEVSSQNHTLVTLHHREEVLGNHRVDGWVDPRAALDVMAKRNISASAVKQTPATQPIASHFFYSTLLVHYPYRKC